MKKLYFCVSLALAGWMTSCVDKNEEVDADSKPAWLGASIYAELQNPNQNALTGTFNYYLRLVNDLDYAETLNKTGSKTVFPANDEAFERFFKQNDWGVSSYEQLTESQKKLLLYSSMLDNAMLVSMLSNTSGSDGIMRGYAMKHQTAIDAIDSITHFYSKAQMPEGNKYWTQYYDHGIDIVSDNTTPMMVHLTREYMVNNGITTVGEGSDFEILTGQPYTDGAAYVFNNRIITKSPYTDGKTCQNGYIHQVENVLLPPGNMGQEIARDSETSLYSRMLDYFCAPYYDAATTNKYNAAAIQYGKPLIDSIFQKRYFSDNSQGASLSYGPDNQRVEASLKFDPGWNTYRMKQVGTTDNSIADIAAMFVPTDEAIKNYFLPGGAGSFFMDIYGSKPNKEENLKDNLDTLYVKKPDVLSKIIRNLQHSSFAGSVPSKFSTLPSDGGEYLAVSLNNLHKKADNQYDVKIANNGVIYKIDEMVAPDEFSSVFAPASWYPDLQVMKWMVEQPSSEAGSDFKYYLLAMQANYAFFIPEDSAFANYMYVNPASLGKVEPEALKFNYIYNEKYKRWELKVQRYKYDIVNNRPGDFISEVSSVKTYKSQINDILNNHTVVLEAGETFGINNYYKTKNGGAIKVSNVRNGGVVGSGAQIDNNQPMSNITGMYDERNGVAFRIDRIIETPRNSVYKTLKETHQDHFSKFFSLCEWLDGSEELMNWLGISDEPNSFGVSPQDRYRVFTSTYGSGANAIGDACLDMNVKMFNTYNYTLYAPSNAAMDAAYSKGLPRPEEMDAEYERLNQLADGSDEQEVGKALLYEQLGIIRNFVRYHFQSVSVYADNVVADGKYSTMLTDEVGVAYVNQVSGGDGKLQVTDAHGTIHTIDANRTDKYSNLMTRDYWFDGEKTSKATAIKTSSFCVIHELSEAMNWLSSDRYDGGNSKSKAVQVYKILKAKNEL